MTSLPYNCVETAEQENDEEMIHSQSSKELVMAQKSRKEYFKFNSMLKWLDRYKMPEKTAVYVDGMFFNLLKFEEDPISEYIRQCRRIDPHAIVTSIEICKQKLGMTLEEITGLALKLGRNGRGANCQFNETGSKVLMEQLGPSWETIVHDAAFIAQRSKDSRNYVQQRQSMSSKTYGYANSIVIPEGAYFPGKVVHIESPSEFYIMPAEHPPFECTDGARDISDLEQLPYMGIKGFFNLIQDLTYTVKLNQTSDDKDKEQSFEVGDPVAYFADFDKTDKELKIFPGKEPKWLRGMIREKILLGSTQETPIIKYCVKLIDYGPEIVVSADLKKIISLPVEFLDFPPLVYKCSLFGIKPILGTWDANAIAEFRHLVRYNLMNIQIHEKPSQDLGKIYIVSLVDGTKEETCVNIGNQMVSKHSAVHVLNQG